MLQTTEYKLTDAQSAELKGLSTGEYMEDGSRIIDKLTEWFGFDQTKKSVSTMDLMSYGIATRKILVHYREA